MSAVRPRSHSSDSPDPTGWQSARGRVSGIGGNGDEDFDYGQFQRKRRRRDSLVRMGYLALLAR
jgi:hypothetical protein